MIPITNATLRSVTAVGNTADYDTPAGAGDVRWSGAVGAYVVDELVEIRISSGRGPAVGTGDVTEVRRTSIALPTQVARIIKRGDTLDFDYQGVSQSRVVRDLRITEIVGTGRVVLEDA